MTQIIFGDLVVDVVLKNIKNLHLSVYPPDGKVKVAAPERMDIDSIRIYVISKLEWIRKQQDKFITQDREDIRDFINRESHYYLGKRYLLNVCALHEQSAPAASNRKISKLQIILVKLCLKQVYFSRGCKSLMHGVVPEALASRKLVVGDDSSEGSETAKSGTDEQKRYMRHNCLG